MDHKFTNVTGVQETSDSTSRCLFAEASPSFSVEPSVGNWLFKGAAAGLGSGRSTLLSSTESPETTEKIVNFSWPVYQEDESGPETLLPSEGFQGWDQLNNSNTRKQKRSVSRGLDESQHCLVAAETETSFDYISNPKLAARCKVEDANYVETFSPLDRSEQDWEAIVSKLNKVVKINKYLQEQLQTLQTNKEELKLQLYAAKIDKSAADEKLNEVLKKNKLMSSVIHQYQSQSANYWLLGEDRRVANELGDIREDTIMQLQHAFDMALSLQKELSSTRVVIERQTALINQLQQQQKPSVQLSENTASTGEQTKRFENVIVLESARSISISTDVKSTALESHQALTDETSVPKSPHNPVSRTKSNSGSTTGSGAVPKHVVPKSDTMECHQRPVSQRANRIPKTAMFGIPFVSRDSLAKKHHFANSCPICSNLIPEMPPGAYTRHVDECLSKVKREVPLSGQSVGLTPLTTVSVADDDSKCPICSMTFTAELSEVERTQHVNDHFDDPRANSFEILNFK